MKCNNCESENVYTKHKETLCADCLQYDTVTERHLVTDCCGVDTCTEIVIEHLRSDFHLNAGDYDGTCPRCNNDDLEQIDGTMECQELKCANGHEFAIASKGWTISFGNMVDL